MSFEPSLAKGADLTPESWADFVVRLRHDCVGEGVREHYTADAVFLVQKRIKVYCMEGYDGEAYEIYSPGDGESYSPASWYEDLEGDDQQRLDAECPGIGFLSAEMHNQINALSEVRPDDEVHEFTCDWETVNQHFTKDAAEAFIARKKHDYRDGLRVYVDASTYSWELNTIKAAILSGRIGLLPEPAVQGGSHAAEPVCSA